MLKEILRQQKDQIEPIIKALEGFKDAYHTLLLTWYSSGILDHTESLDKYPFAKNFDELEVIEWVEATIEEIRTALFQMQKSNRMTTIED